jgi:hypothetical protein
MVIRVPRRKHLTRATSYRLPASRVPNCGLSIAEALAKHKIKPPKTDMSCTNRKKVDAKTDFDCDEDLETVDYRRSRTVEAQYTQLVPSISSGYGECGENLKPTCNVRAISRNGISQHIGAEGESLLKVT